MGSAIDIIETPDLAIPRQDHARLCRRACHLCRQHGHRLSRLRARLRRRRVVPEQRVGSRSGAQYRPRTDLVPVAGAILRGDRQGRRRQGGAGGRSQPERRHRSIDEGHHRSGAARSGHAAGPGIHHLHQDFCRYSQGQERERVGGAKPADARRHVAPLQARRSRQQRRRSRTAGNRTRRQAGCRAISGGDRAGQYLRHQLRQDGCDRRAGAAEIRRKLAQGDLFDR